MKLEYDGTKLCYDGKLCICGTMPTTCDICQSSSKIADVAFQITGLAATQPPAPDPEWVADPSLGAITTALNVSSNLNSVPNRSPCSATKFFYYLSPDPVVFKSDVVHWSFGIGRFASINGGAPVDMIFVDVKARVQFDGGFSFALENRLVWELTANDDPTLWDAGGNIDCSRITGLILPNVFAQASSPYDVNDYITGASTSEVEITSVTLV